MVVFIYFSEHLGHLNNYCGTLIFIIKSSMQAAQKKSTKQEGEEKSVIPVKAISC